MRQVSVKKWLKAASRAGFIPTVPIIIMVLIVLTALLAPLIAPYSPIKGSLPDKLVPPAWVEGGSMEHVLGTDFLGRDVLSRIIHGTRVSLLVSLLAVFVAGAFGTSVGLISGFFGGRIDSLLMRITDIGLSLPMILMAIVLVTAVGPSFGNVILVIVVLLWPRYARQIRGEVLSVKEREFVALAHIADCSPFRIITRHLLPNVMPTLLVLATLQVGFVILLEAGLSFLGVGIPAPTPAWGLMVAEGRGLIASAWWLSLFPGIAILLAVLSVNLLGDWTRDRLDPKLRQV